MRIVAFDPGGTTGAAVGDITTRRQFELQCVTQFDWDDRFNIWEFLKEQRPDQVVIEDFRLYKHKAQDQINSPFPAVRVIGIIDAFCHLMEIPVAMQPASAISRVKVLSPDQVQITTMHQSDAYKHLRCYVILNT